MHFFEIVPHDTIQKREGHNFDFGGLLVQELKAKLEVETRIFIKLSLDNNLIISELL